MHDVLGVAVAEAAEAVHLIITTPIIYSYSTLHGL